MSLAVAVAVIGVMLLFFGRFVWRILLGGVKLALLSALVLFVLNYQEGKHSVADFQERKAAAAGAALPQEDSALFRLKDIAQEVHRRFSAYELHVEIRRNDERRY